MGGAFERERAAAPEPCADVERPVDEVWTKDARARLEAALTSDHFAFADTGIDAWTERWRGTAREACEQVHVTQLASTESLDVSGDCLYEQARELSSILRELEGADATGPRVVRALSLLGQPRDCLDPRGSLTRLEPAQRETHDRLRDELLTIRLDQAGRSVATRRARALEIHELANELELAQVAAESALLLGRLALFAADGEQARRWLGEALDRSVALELEELRLQAQLQLAVAEIEIELDVDGALWHWQRVEHALDGRAFPDRQRALGADVRGRIHVAAGELDQAEIRFDEATAHYEAIGATATQQLAASLRQRALVADRRGDSKRALELHARAHTLSLVSAGASGLDSERGQTRVNDAIALIGAGDLDAARTGARGRRRTDRGRARADQRGPRRCPHRALGRRGHGG